MTELHKSLEVSQFVKAPTEQVYDALTNQLSLQAWFSDFVEAAPRENGRFYAWWNIGYYTSGVFTKLQENERIGYTWQGLGEPGPTKVDISLVKQSGGTQVTVVHSELGTAESWQEAAAGLEQGWQEALSNLCFLLEKGIDKRQYERPFLGILLSGFVSDDQREKLGLPETAGVLLTDSIVGTGAQAAGLRNEDVLYSLGGRKLKSYADFNVALAEYKAGDQIDIEIYRESEQTKMQMELSRRPYPEVPQDSKALAELIRREYDKIDEELDEVFAEVSEAHATHKPEPQEWSAKEVLAHLLISEQSTAMFIASTTRGQRGGGTYANDHGFHAAVASAYPNVADLIEELKRWEQVTVDTLAALPADFVADKGKYLTLGTGLLTAFGAHQRGHFAQMRAAIETAQRA